MHFKIKEILTNTSSAILFQSGIDVLDKEFKITFAESRIDEDTIFMPVKVKVNTNHVDGFLKIEECIQKGCQVFFFDEIRFGDEKYRNLLLDLINKHKEKIKLVILTKDTAEAHRELARYTRAKRIPNTTKVIAVTGTVGKTTTVEMTYNAIKGGKSIYHRDAQNNIRLWVCQKILDVPDSPDYEYMIFEISGAVQGYLKFFAELLKVDIAIISRVGVENTGIYGSLEEVAKNKLSLLSCVNSNSGGFAIIDDTELLREYSKEYDCEKVFVKSDAHKLVSKGEKGSVFVHDSVEYRTTAIGEHLIANAIKAITVAQKLGVDIPAIQKGLEENMMIGHRWMVEEIDENRTVITDCANNPLDSTLCIIQTFMDLFGHKRNKRIIISNIINLGTYEEDAYKKIAEFLGTLDIQEVICINEKIESIAKYLENNTNIKATRMKETPKITCDCDLVKYLKSTKMEDEAILIKCSFDFGYERTAGFLKE